MAGTWRTEAYPQQQDLNANPQEHGDRAFPDIPKGYKNWNDYIKAVLTANENGMPGPRPYNSFGQDAIGDPSVGPMQWLQHSLGYARLAPYLDQSDPQIQGMLDNMYYAGSSHDEFNFLGDQFFPAVALLGAAVGGAGLYGAFGAGEAAAGAGAGAAGTAGTAGTVAPIGYLSPEIAAAGGGAGAAGTAGALGGAVAPIGYLSPEIIAAGGGSLGNVAPVAAGAAGAAGAGAAGAGALGGAGAGVLGGWGPVIGAGITAGSSLIGGAIAGNAAKNAAQTQAESATEANRILQQQYDQSRADLTPYREAGYKALGQTQDLVNQPIGFDPYQATPTLDPSQYAFDPNQYQFNTDQYRFTAPNQALDPAQYKFAPTSGQQVLNDDPGYQFRLQEGMKALQATQAAKGGLLSGGAVKGALKYGQGLASQEYASAYNRALGRNEMDWTRAQYGNEQTYNRALNENQLGYERGLQGNQMGYERALQGNELGYGRAYQQNADLAARARDQYATNVQTQMGARQQRFNELASMAGLGQTSASQTGTLSAALGNQLSGNITSAGAAQAAGQVGSANAWNQAIGGVGKAANSYLQYDLLNRLLQQRR
jgi:hypothetical protein